MHGFRVSSGQCLYNWTGLGGSSCRELADVAFLLGRRQLINTTDEPHLQVWQLLQNGRLAPLHSSAGNIHGGAHRLAASPCERWLLAAGLHRSVVAFSTDTWQQVAAMQLEHAPACLLFTGLTGHFLVAVGPHVQAYRLRSGPLPWLSLTSPISAVTRIHGQDLLLAVSEDSSVRLVRGACTVSMQHL